MRLLVDTLIAAMLAAVLGSIVWYQRHEALELDQVAAVQEALRCIQGQSAYRVAIGEADASPTGFAAHVKPDWFDPIPRNLLVDRGVTDPPWLEEAAPGESQRFDPADIVADEQTPAFWYNPHRGLVRARVPMQISQQSTVELYNLVNGTSVRVDEVAWDAPPPPADRVIDPTRKRPTTSVTATPTEGVLRDFSAHK
jgi:hypothetical protein